MTTYTMMASLTFILLLTGTLHAAPFTVYEQKDTNFKATRTSPLEFIHESVPKCVVYKRKRYAICENLNLTSVPEYLTPDIHMLSLKDNLIKNLFNSSFLRYPQLTHLRITENDIRSIESGTFQPLAHLVHLDISRNRHLEHLNPNIFMWSQRLSFISLQGCALKSFPQNTTYIQPFKQVHILLLDMNKITRINISCHPESQEIVDVISLQVNNFKELTHQTFNLDCDVNNLYLSGNNIISIDPYTIASLRVHTFVFGNAFINIKKEVWYNLMSGIAKSNIKYLSMSFVEFFTFNPNFLSPLTHYPLSTLELISSQPYDSMTFHGFKFLDLLLELIVTSCIIPKLEPEYFFGMNRLQIINFKEDTVMHINPSNSYWSVVHMREIYLCHNELREIMPRTFQGLANVSVLDLAYNKNLVKLHAEAFYGLYNLQYLNVSGTSLSSLYLNTPLLKSMTSSDLEGDCLMPGRTFSYTPLLESLDLTNSKVSLHNLWRSSLNVSLFDGLSNLNHLSLKLNPIVHLVSGVFQGLSALEFLDLSYCQIRNIEANTFDPIFAKLRTIDISNNQLVCNCELTWLVEWLNGPINVLNVTVCSAGSGTLAPLRGKPLLTFIPNELCGPNILLMCLIPLAAIGLIATICVVYHYRWYVMFKLYLLKLAVLGYKEVSDARDHGDFEFDLNIMFLEDNAQWVADYLKPVLEERLPNFNRNAIGDDDLILGMHFFDAVFYVIEKSFKTIILLSRAAVKDNWFMIKFRIAFEQVNDARMENVVVVFLEDIPDAEIPFLVRLYLSEHRTYLEWMEDERGQEYFWDELIVTLQRENVRWNNVIPPE